MKSKQWKERTKCIIASFKVDHIVPYKSVFTMSKNMKSARNANLQ